MERVTHTEWPSFNTRSVKTWTRWTDAAKIVNQERDASGNVDRDWLRNRCFRMAQRKWFKGSIHEVITEQC